MIIASLTLAIIGCAFGISLLPDPGSKLQVFYLCLALIVFISGLRSRSYLYLVLGTLLFARWAVENIEYQWTPLFWLSAGHLVLALVTFYAVFGAKQRILLYFPALMLCQFFSDVLYIKDPYFYYGYLHNVLAIMQMSAFIVLAWDRRKMPIAKDPIVNLINRFARDWLAWKQNAGRTFPHV